MQVAKLSSPQKLSTSQLKKALEKIKQTQLEVLSALKNQAEYSNINDSNPKIHIQNVQADLPYIKSISHLNLLKMSEINHMRKSFQREKQQYQDKMANLKQRIRMLERELELKNKLQIQWANEKQKLREKIYQAQLGSQVSSESLIKAQVIAYNNALAEKVNNQLISKEQVQKYKLRIRQLQQQNQSYKRKYESVLRQSLQKESTKLQRKEKVAHQQQKNRPLQEMMGEIIKIGERHNQVYQSLKTRARITVADINIQQQISQSISKIISLIEKGQRHWGSEYKKMIQIDDSAIQDGKVYESESFREQVKKLDKQLFNHEQLKKQIHDLNAQIIQLKQHNTKTQNQVIELRSKLASCQSQLARIRQVGGSDYEGLIDDLERQMRKIREQKNALTNLVRKISQNAFRSESKELNEAMHQQIGQLLDLNEQLKNQNQSNRVVVESSLIQRQQLKYQCQKQVRQNKQVKALLQHQIQTKNTMSKQLAEKDRSIHKLQQTLSQLRSTLQGNSKRNEIQLKSKLKQIQLQRGQIQKDQRQLRNLREVAYNFQLVSGQNQMLKRKLMQVNSTVIHLWQVKQAQYSNIRSILDQCNKS